MTASSAILLIEDEAADVAVHTVEPAEVVHFCDFDYVNTLGASFAVTLVEDLDRAVELPDGLREVALGTVARWLARRARRYVAMGATEDPAVSAALTAWETAASSEVAVAWAAARRAAERV